MSCLEKQVTCLVQLQWLFLNVAIYAVHKLLHFLPHDWHRERALAWIILANTLHIRYKQLGGIDDLNEAIVLARDALSLCPPGHPARSMSLSNLADHLSSRYDKLGGIDDTNEAIVLTQEALSLRPLGHPDRSVSLNYLANRLVSRYDQLGGTDDLNRAIFLGREGLSLCLPGHPHRSGYPQDPARFHFIRFARLAQEEDKEEPFNLFAQLEHMSQALASVNLSAAKAWINAAEEIGRASCRERVCT